MDPLKVTEKVTEKVTGLGTQKVGELGEYLREQRHSAQLSLRQLAEVAGVSNPYLSQVERGLRKPSAEVLQQIAKGLRISAEAVYVRAGILDERDDRMEVEAAVMADRHLTERQRHVLLDIYATFRSTDERDAGAAVAQAVSAAAGASAGVDDPTGAAAGPALPAPPSPVRRRAARSAAPRPAGTKKVASGKRASARKGVAGPETR